MRSNAIPPAVPAEFEDLLNRNGRKVLAGTHPLCGALADPRTRLLAADDLFDRAKAARLRAVLEERLTGTLVPLVRPIPPESIFDIKHNYSEQLPKTTRARTVFFDSRREQGVKMAERIGLARLMRSESFHAFAEALAGRKLASGWGLQVLRYGPGDYAGPHNDHHPENERAKHGYIDLHLSLCTPGVAHQWLVYSRAGHFSEIVSVAAPVTLTAYRLPFWHYTTPLVGKPAAARWVLLGTFLFSRIPQLNLPSDPAGRAASRQ